jgi:GT2 family glycosyltransferase
MTQPEISCCIVSFNTCDLLRDCLNAIYQFPPSCPFEIIVVDNSSNDGTQEMLRESYPEVHFVENERNEGYTGPMNTAMKLGRGKYLVQLNPDTLVRPDTFDPLVCFLEEHAEAGICTPKVLNRDGSLQKQCRRSAGRPWDAFTYFSGLAKRYPDNPRYAGYLMTYLEENEVNEVEAVSGSCMMIRREVIDQIGYLDERFFAYQEDADFCFRARLAGWKIFYVPAAQIIHFGGQGGSKVEIYQSIYHWHRSYFLYYRKHLAREYNFVMDMLVFLGVGIKMATAFGTTLLRREKYVGTRKP